MTCGPKSRSGRRALRSAHTLLRQVEDDRDRQHVVLAGQVDQLAARFRLHVGRVDDGQPPAGQALAHDVVQQLERVRGGGLVVLVVGDQAAAEVRRDHLGRLEVRAGERRLARAGDADEDHEAARGWKARCSWGPPSSSTGVGSPARVNTASCVGGPTAGVVPVRPRRGGPVAVGGAGPGRPRGELGAVHSNRWSRCRIAPAASVRTRGCTRAFGVVTTTVPVRRSRRRPARARPAGRVDVLDDLHQHGGVEAGQPVVAVGERGLEDLSRARCGSGIRSSRSRRAACARARADTSAAMTRVERAVVEQVPGQRALAAAEVPTLRAPGLAQHAEHGLPPQHRERHRASGPRRLGRGPALRFGSPADPGVSGLRVRHRVVQVGGVECRRTRPAAPARTRSASAGAPGTAG
jgi:hypothetical protein